MMDSFHISANKIIIAKLELVLNRELTEIEKEVFSIPRSGMAYEVIGDEISDKSKSKSDIENYVKDVVDNYLLRTNKK